MDSSPFWLMSHANAARSRGVAVSAAEQAAELQINVIDSAQLRTGTGQPLSI